MIQFGFGIAERQGGCAYFTRLTFRSRLQVFDWHALLGLCLSAAKKKRKKKHPPCFEKTQPQTQRVQKILGILGYTVTGVCV